MNEVSEISINLPTDTIAAASFLFLTAIYIVFTLILRYHWQAYATDDRVSRLTMWVFYGTTLPLWALTGIMTLYLQT